MKNFFIFALGLVVGVCSSYFLFQYNSNTPATDMVTKESFTLGSKIFMGNSALSFNIPTGWTLLDHSMVPPSANYILVSPDAEFSRQYAADNLIVNGGYIEITVKDDEGYKKMGLEDSKSYYDWYLDFYKDMKPEPTKTLIVDGFEFLEYEKSVFGVIKEYSISLYYGNDEKYSTAEMEKIFSSVIDSIEIVDLEYYR